MKQVKRIDLLAPPFKGHLHPVLAMGRQLVEAGFDVCVLSTPAAQADIEAAGLPCLLLTAIDDAQLLAVVNPPYAVKATPHKLAKQFRQVLGMFAALSDQLTLIYRQRQVDLVIADFTLAPVGPVMHRFGVRWWTSLPSPCVVECPDGPPAYLGGLPPAHNLLTALRNRLGRELVRCFKRAVFFWYRRAINAMGVAQLYREDGTETIYSSDCILCLGDRELEFTRSWPPACRFVGPQLYTPAHSAGDRAPPWVPGKRHMLVTLGTHLHWHKDAVWRQLQALAPALADWQIHFTDGRTDLPASAERDDLANCVRLDYVNYSAQLANYDLVIHHGGAGIMYHCLLRAIPSVVYPVDYDQFDHAARLQAKGLAVWLRNLTDLPTAIALALAPQIANNLRNYCAERYQPASVAALVAQALAATGSPRVQ